MKTTDLAHLFWTTWIKPGDTIIDATCGNGHDLVFLARLLEGEGRLVGYDLQAQALQNTRERLERELTPEERQIISLKQASHEHFEEDQAHLIVYNLGYLPGGDKGITTHLESTLRSLEAAQKILVPGGRISLICYIGHEEGAKEAEALEKYASSLPKEAWSVLCLKWINREKAPFLIVIQKSPSLAAHHLTKSAETME